MEKQNNKLEEFLKGRINKLDSSGSDWDRPGSHVWEQAQTQFPNYPIKKKRRPFLWLFVLLSLLLGFYTIYLHKKETTATKTIIATELELQESQQQIEILKKEQEVVVSQLKNENEQTALTIEDLQVKQQSALSVIQRQRNSLQQLAKTNKILEDDLRRALAMVTSIDSDKVQEEVNQTVLTANSKEWNQALFVSLSLPSLNEQFSSPITKIKEDLALVMMPPITPAKRLRKPFEVGLTYGNQRLVVPVYSVFKDGDVFEKEASEVVETTWIKGFHLGYEILSGLYIKAGIQQGGATQDESYNATFSYDKDGEYINSEGKISNDLQLDINSPYGAFRNDMTVELSDNTPEDGDLLKVNYYNVQETKLIRVPLGVEYFLGKRKLQFQLQGGLAWNKIFVSNNDIEGNLYIEDEKIPLMNVKMIGDKSYQKTFTSGYIGGGLDYALTPRWHLRASYAVERHFLKDIESDKKDVLSFNTRWLDMGIFYRF